MPNAEQLLDAVSIPIPVWDRATITALLPTGDHTYLRTPEDHTVPTRGAPEVIGWSARLATMTFHEAIDRLEERLGEAHQITGPPTTLRWWADGTRQVMLESGFRGEPMLRIFPSEWQSLIEMKEMESYEDFEEAPYLWIAERGIRKAPAGTWYPGGFQPPDTATLAREVRKVLQSFADAADELPERYLHSGAVRAVDPVARTDAHGRPVTVWYTVTVYGEPWKVEWSPQGGVGTKEESADDREKDLPVYTERLISEVTAWGRAPEELGMRCFSEGRAPAKRGTKRLLYTTRFLTLGGTHR